MSAFGGDDVDTLALMFDKLQYIFRGYDPYIQSFAQTCQLYKEGKISEREYYNAVSDAVFKYSALEFLGLKAMFEIKKALNRMNSPKSARSQGAGLVSEMMGQSARGPQNTLASFISTKSIPGRDDLVQKMSGNGRKCASCGNVLSNTAKFCTGCGNKV